MPWVEKRNCGMNLSIREDYWAEPDRKKQFIESLRRIHGLDLTLWDQMGFWDKQNYRPFSYFDGDQVVANVCVYSMDMVVSAKRRSVAQITSVGTLPEYRKMGLGRELMRRTIDWARPRHEFFYLFADDEAFSFYQNFGFRRAEEHKPRMSVTGAEAAPGAMKLDLDNRECVDLVYRHAVERTAVSDELGTLSPNLFMFRCLYPLREHIYHVPVLDLLVLYKRHNNVPTVFDIVGQSIPPFSEIYPFICDPHDKAVEFYFMTDKLRLSDESDSKDLDFAQVDGNGTHLLGDFPLDGQKFIFPYTSRA